VGAAVAAGVQSDLGEPLQRIQSTLFDLGAQLATPDPDRRAKNGMKDLSAGDVRVLEDQIDRFEQELKPLKAFVLPGGTPAAAALHLARTVCRRAERRLVALARDEPVGDEAVRWVNRLSDLLFVLARFENHRAGHKEIKWHGRSG
jgi:cob(I)alamin adenosyltransferase